MTTQIDSLVMPGLVPGIHVFVFWKGKAWMAGSSPAMTAERASNPLQPAPRYLRFHPPRLPGAPPDERGAGPNSGPDCCESVGWKILLPWPKGFSGSARLAR
jgi:hypothetical protein